MTQKEKVIELIVGAICSNPDGLRYRFSDIESIADNLLANGVTVQTVDAVPVVHGRWIELEPEIGLMECNLCGHKIMRATCNYCPNCGARMDGDE